MQHNSFYIAIKSVMDVITHDVPNYKLVISEKEPIGAATRTYNKPVCNEVAVIIVNESLTDDIAPSKRELILHTQNGGPLRTMPSNNSFYDTLSYVLTHIHGDIGWTFGQHKYKKQGDQWISHPSAGNITAMDFYRYRLHIRDTLQSLQI